MVDGHWRLMTNHIPGSSNLAESMAPPCQQNKPNCRCNDINIHSLTTTEKKGRQQWQNEAKRLQNITKVIQNRSFSSEISLGPQGNGVTNRRHVVPVSPTWPSRRNRRSGWLWSTCGCYQVTENNLYHFQCMFIALSLEPLDFSNTVHVYYALFKHVLSLSAGSMSHHFDTFEKIATCIIK